MAGSVRWRKWRGRIERHDQQPVGYLSRQPDHLGAQPADGERWHAERVRTRVERGRHQGVGAELATEVEPLAELPRGEDGPQGGDELAHPGDRPIEGRAVALLHLGPDLGAEAQGEAASGQQLEVVGLVGQLHRVAREGDGHVGGQLEGGRGRGSQDERGEHVVGALEGERPVHTELLERPGLGGRVGQSGQPGVDLRAHHGPMLPPPSPPRPSRDGAATGPRPRPVPPDAAPACDR